MRTPKADDLIEAELKKHNEALAKHFVADAVIIKAPIRFGIDNEIRDEIENLHLDGDRPKTLTVLLETTGGYIEVVERIYNVFRKHYQLVNFIVPNFAYSAGTVLVLSGDEIYMDYFSVLGPIDPQLENENGRFVSGLGYLAKYQELLGTINSAETPASVRAELAYLLKKFDPAELFDLKQAKGHAEDLLEEWLSRHKFKDWNETETNKAPVTDDHRRARAKSIAEILGNPERWRSHGRGIGLKELTSEEIRLKIVDFGSDDGLNGKVRSYYGLFTDYCRKTGVDGVEAAVMHTSNGLRRF